SGLPTSGKSRPCAKATAGTASRIAGKRTLSEHCIGDAPVASDLPGLNGIHVNGARTFLCGPILFLHAPMVGQFGQRRLNVTPFLRCTGHAPRLLPIPRPVKIEPGMRL